MYLTICPSSSTGDKSTNNPYANNCSQVKKKKKVLIICKTILSKMRHLVIKLQECAILKAKMLKLIYRKIKDCNI